MKDLLENSDAQAVDDAHTYPLLFCCVILFPAAQERQLRRKTQTAYPYATRLRPFVLAFMEGRVAWRVMQVSGIKVGIGRQRALGRTLYGVPMAMHDVRVKSTRLANRSFTLDRIKYWDVVCGQKDRRRSARAMHKTGRQRDVTQRYYASAVSNFPRFLFLGASFALSELCLAGGRTGISSFISLFSLHLLIPCRGQGGKDQSQILRSV